MACLPQASHLGLGSMPRFCFFCAFLKTLTPFFLSFLLLSTHLHLGRQGRTKRLFFHNFRAINLMSKELGASPWVLLVWLLGGVSGFQWCFRDHGILFKSLRLGWRVVSEVKSTGLSPRGPGFSPQHPHVLHRHRSDSTEHPTVLTSTRVDLEAAL